MLLFSFDGKYLFLAPNKFALYTLKEWLVGSNINRLDIVVIVNKISHITSETLVLGILNFSFIFNLFFLRFLKNWFSSFLKSDL